MYKRLRLQLTMLCMLGSFLVLAGMATLSFTFSLRQLKNQSEAAFRSSVNTVLFYMQGTEVIDNTWLAQTEADNEVYIRIEYGGQTLDYTARDALRVSATDAGLAEASRLYPALWEEGALSLGSTTDLYTFSHEGHEYQAAICQLPRNSGRYTVLLVKDLSGQNATARELVVLYTLGTLGAALLLGVFAWLFSGRAIRPALLAEQKQKEFLSAASHELRSPLAVIRLSAGSIKTLPAKAPALADKIERECERLGTLIGDLLLLTGGAAGMRLQLGPVSPQTILLTSCERFEAIAAQKGIRLTPRAVAESTETAQWDTARIEQALAVLLDNAISYTPQGGKILVTLQVQGGTATYTVEDSGPGVPPEDREKVFERFYRADSSRSKKEHYGLGLSVAREIARLHGGKIRLEQSEALGGAAFHLSLPTKI